MPVPVFEQLHEIESKPEIIAAKKPSYTGGAIFFAILMVVALVVLGEYAFRDSSRLFNPYYQDCQMPTKSSFLTPSKPTPVPANCQLERYERARLILHADVVVPIVLVMLIVYVATRRRLESAQVKLILYAIYIFSGWLIVRLVVETESYLLKHHTLVGRYTAVLSVVALLATMIIIIQQRANKKVG